MSNFSKTDDGQLIFERSSLEYKENQPECFYSDPVHLRIIVLAYNRPEALQILLTSLNKLEMDGDISAMEVWIDRNKTGAL